jgi:serine protease Do
MNRALRYGLILLLAAPATLAWADGAPNGAAFLLMSGAGASSSHSGPGYLGVSVRDVSGDQIGVLKLKEARGAEIVLVDHDAPAGKAGLREHDVVLQMNGQAIAGEDQLRHMLHDCSPGRTIVLIISRDGQQMTVTTQMAISQEEVEREAWERHITVPEPQDAFDVPESNGPASPAPSAPPVRAGNSFIGAILPSSSYTGALLEKMPAQLAGYFGAVGGHGLLVSSVKPNSPAALAGMQAGDVVVRANQKAIASTGDWAKAVKSSHGRTLAVTVLRDKKEQTLTLTPDARKHSELAFPQLPSEHTAQDETAPVVVARIGFSWLPRS